MYKERKLISRMTLAVLHDSGWYNVDFSAADTGYTWARGLGCNFAMKSCHEFMKTKSNIQPYCNSPTNFQLPRKLRSSDRNSVNFCNLVKYGKPLPPEYQNLDTEIAGDISDDETQWSHYGAGMVIADFCPTVVTMSPVSK